ncbi:hypothetical protein BDW62DRAFT_220924 [Aspergillus aurantiobrunneus]
MLRRLSSIGCIATALVASCSTAAANSMFSITSSTSTGYPPCDALVTAGLGNRVLVATDPEYEPQIQSYWSWGTRRRPYCLVQPHNAQEVSTIMTTLLADDGVRTGAGDWHIAIRAGGHNLGNSNNIEQGVTIDLKYLNQTTYNPATNIASLGPGKKWQDVYAALHQHGVVATGGRNGDVGVGGFLLGGGSTYYMAQEGFGCDSIANFEVVLVNGTIVNANRNENADLWRALKGGGSNFGIVTRYDMVALPDKQLARGQRALSGNYTAPFLDAVAGFTDDQKKGDADALVGILVHSGGQDVLSTIEVNTDGVEKSTAFAKFNEIPQLAPFTQSRQYLYEAAADSQFSGDAWALQTTLTFKNDRKMLNYVAAANKKLTQSLQQALGKDAFQTVIFLQPLPSFYAEISAVKGGNMFADTLKDGNAVLWTGGVLVNTTQADFAVASARMHETVADLESYSMHIGADHPLRYLNYASFAQDPLGSYPAESVEYMKSVAAKYDPQGKFQTRLPGGFKISRVEA